MSIKDKSKAELEQMSYIDIAYEILKEAKKRYNTPNLFKKVCKLLELSEDEFSAQIGDFFTALSTDQRFLLMDSVYWDLKENHVVKVVVDDGEEDEMEIEESEETEADEEVETEDDISEDDYSEDALDDNIDPDEAMGDLTIIEDDESEE